jgi:hypothetical protein
MTIDEQVSDDSVKYFFDKKTLFHVVNIHLAHNSHSITDREYIQSLRTIKEEYGWSNLLTNYFSQENFKN